MRQACCLAHALLIFLQICVLTRISITAVFSLRHLINASIDAFVDCNVHYAAYHHINNVVHVHAIVLRFASIQLIAANCADFRANRETIPRIAQFGFRRCLRVLHQVRRLSWVVDDFRVNQRSGALSSLVNRARFQGRIDPENRASPRR